MTACVVTACAPDPGSGNRDGFLATGTGLFKQNSDSSSVAVPRSPNRNQIAMAARTTTTTVPDAHAPTPVPPPAIVAPTTTVASAPDTTGTRRDPFLWPFASDSPWNRPLGSGATYSGADDPQTRTVQAAAGGAYINSGQWSLPVYQASASDPWSTIGYDGTTFRVPADARPSLPAGGDENLIVVDPTKSFADELWGSSRSGSDWNAGYHIRTDIRGAGVGDGGVRAAGVSALGGLLRSWEISAGSVRHALAVALPREALRSGPIWPAISEDGFSYEYSGNIPMGTLLAIPSWVDLDALGLSRDGLAVAQALQRYGAYVSDASHGTVFYAETAAEPLLGSVRADLPRIGSLLRVVTNNTRTSPSGGGTPLAPAAPPLG